MGNDRSEFIMEPWRIVLGIPVSVAQHDFVHVVNPSACRRDLGCLFKPQIVDFSCAERLVRLAPTQVIVSVHDDFEPTISHATLLSGPSLHAARNLFSSKRPLVLCKLSAKIRAAMLRACKSGIDR